MSDTPTTLEPSAISRLKTHLERGVKLVSGPTLLHGQVRIWIAQTRSPLRAIFGHGSPILVDWPPASGLLPQGDPKELLETKLLRLECLISTLHESERTSAVPGSRVFIGHGRSPMWRELKDFLSDRLALRWEEFNRESTAGIATTERLTEMLTSAAFAFLIMTAEDEHADETLHARENVIHEVGLFQGKLGLRRAIILLEEGCSTFSNINGLTYISFPRGDISAAFEKIRRVLERERIVGA